MPIRVGMISLGCPKNQVDAEIMLARLHDENYVLTPDVSSADVVVINTCGFIEDAKKESIENILEMAQLKKEGKIKGIVVTGCLAQRYFKEMEQEFPEVSCILSVGSAGAIAQAVKAAYENKKLNLYEAPEKLEISGKRVKTTLPFYSYLKIAEGCNNRCSYCIIPYLRGRYRSRPIEELVNEAKELAEGGVKELILVAQDTTRYGEDLYHKLALPQLLRELCKIEKLKWIRILYCYPDMVTDELIDVIANEEKIVKYIDLPIQHVSPRIVKAMNRRDTKEDLEALIKKLREKIPGVILRTTLIVGFPGETEEDFALLDEFVREIKFDRLGVFTYSQEEGTPAAVMPNQIDEEVKARRQEIIMETQSQIVESKNNAMIGKTIEVLCEGYDKHAGYCYGRSAADAPEIDGKVFFTAKKRPAAGEFVNVRITDVCDYDLTGEAVLEKWRE
ncbi:Ribosomal protein S12 methylthiotransferase RimO [[Clostridium] cellulosi]|uniref:Ribosomal protein uS12 methylthiotransferase RimO n=1 Tax=[Clostridium] cellulosi TaxID=29343 RepID=A0A078KQS3_9FIRM|nr:Ribosomal protein S12 methylthiotransferase RimO [[Clostridium] cellulosi]